MMRKPGIFPALFCLLLAACSINKMAMRSVSDALTGDGSSEVFSSDPDPQLVGDALPFALKMYESLLSSNPEHQGLCRTTGSLFVMYANAFVQGPAEQLPPAGYAEKQAELERAGKLYLRGLELLYRGLDLKYPGFSSSFDNSIPPGSPPEAFSGLLAKTGKEDVSSLYWAAVGGISAYSLSPLDPGLGLRLGEFLALVHRSYELDSEYGRGALDDFLLLFYASVPELMGGDRAKAEIHFRKALEKSNESLASPYVSYARAVSIPAQDYDTFKACLEAALAIDVDADPANRLVNILSQRKARFLLDSAARFFVSFPVDDGRGGEWDNDEWDY